MFMAFMALVIIASAPLLGGRLDLLSRVRFAHPAVLVAALVIQIVITEIVATWPRVVLVGLHLASYAMAAFVLWANRRLPGLVVLGVGAMSNAIVIALNGGTLPASARALRQAGFPVDPSTFENSGVLAHPVLPWLGDIVATPAWLPFRNVISVGDALVLIGAAIFVHSVSRSRAWSALRGRSHDLVGSATGDVENSRPGPSPV